MDHAQLQQRADSDLSLLQAAASRTVRGLLAARRCTRTVAKERAHLSR